MTVSAPKIAVLPELAGTRVLVVGLGVTGLSVIRYLRGLGCQVAVTDTRAQPPGVAALREEFPDVAMMLGGLDARAFAAADQVVLSPGLSLTELGPHLGDRDLPVCGDIELFAQAVQVPVLAITGSNGKSTVTALLGQMARHAGVRVGVGGNLGPPALDLLSAESELYVLELSSFQLETTCSLRTRAATVLNLSPDHLDRYADMTAYAAAKARIFLGAEVAVVNRDDQGSLEAAPASLEQVRFGLGEPEREADWGVANLDGPGGFEPWILRGERRLMPTRELRLVGTHHLANALAALALGDVYGLPLDAMREVVTTFSGLPHRCTLVAEAGGVRWIDDSKGTNPGATLAALEGVASAQGTDERIVLIAGGEGKGADFAPLTPVLARTARAVVLIGRDAPLIQQVVPHSVPCLLAEDMTAAVARAAELARAGDAVLLSPACASFDMFADYRARGRAFAEAAKRLAS